MNRNTLIAITLTLAACFAVPSAISRGTSIGEVTIAGTTASDAARLPIRAVTNGDGTATLSVGVTSGTVTSTPGPNTSTTAYTGAQAVKTVAATGTPERMAAATTLCDSVLIEGKNARGTNNTGNIFIGYAATNDSQLLLITPGQSITITAPAGKKVDLNLLYIDVATNADGVIYHTQN